MDAHRFDAIARVLVTETTRRRPLAALLGGTLAVLGLSSPDDGLAATGKCKPKCGTCQQCKKGRCKRTKRGKTCKKGKCRPKQDGSVCGECQACQQGACETVPNGTACGENRSCQEGVCEANPACGTGAPCRVFISSSTHTGDLGGLSGADTICQGLAENAQLPGTYKAWLSDASESPVTRFTKNPGPYVLVDGTEIATDWEDLTDGLLAAPIELTEGETPVGINHPWTNTRGNGTAFNGVSPTVDHCSNWSAGNGTQSGRLGTTNSTTNGGWSSNVSGSCDRLRPFYCFQQG